MEQIGRNFQRDEQITLHFATFIGVAKRGAKTRRDRGKFP